MNNKKKIGIIGCGNMGSAIISGIKGKHNVLLSEKDKKKATVICKKYKLTNFSINDLVKKADIILLAVKPQNFSDVLAEVRKNINFKKLVISIAAGITTKFIEKALGKEVRVIRTMPNLPAQIGCGITAIAKGKLSTASDVKTACGIFNNIGETVVVKESQIDAITAVSGSGPAYIFLVAEAMNKASKSLGLSAKDSEKLVLETMIGSVMMLDGSKDTAEVLRKRVTSKGGTTEAALKVFFKKNFEKTFKEALSAAKKRAMELSI